MGTARQGGSSELVAACREACPDPLAPLWDTILHAPDVAFPDVVAALLAAFADTDRRIGVILDWLGHSDGSCPVCWMFVGRLVFAVSDPVERVARLVAQGPTPQQLSGAAVFLASRLERRHALPAGVSAEGLEAMRATARDLPAPVQQALLDHWAAQGREVDDLVRALGR